MNLHTQLCTSYQSQNIRFHSKYLTKSSGLCHLLQCCNCNNVFSETSNSFLFNVRTPLSRVAQILRTRLEGLSFNATCRTFHVGTYTLQIWEEKISNLREIISLDYLYYQFLCRIIESYKLYKKTLKNKAAHESEGWTLVLMGRGSCFIWELSCGKKEKALFLRL